MPPQPGFSRPEFQAGLRASLPLLAGLSAGATAELTPIWAPELLPQHGVPSLSLGNERLLAGLVAIGVAWRWRGHLRYDRRRSCRPALFDWMF